jgi:hypothetical protein
MLNVEQSVWNYVKPLRQSTQILVERQIQKQKLNNILNKKSHEN